jgi:hypothetical protein
MATQVEEAVQKAVQQLVLELPRTPQKHHMWVNEDAEVVFPLDRVGEDGKAEHSDLVLRWPTNGEMTVFNRAAKAADRRLRDFNWAYEEVSVDKFGEPGTKKYDAEMERRQAALDERDDMLYGEEPLYAVTLAEIVSALSGEKVTGQELPPWSRDPRSIRGLLSYYQDPFVGGFSSRNGSG